MSSVEPSLNLTTVLIFARLWKKQTILIVYIQQLHTKQNESWEFILVLAGACQVTVKDYFHITEMLIFFTQHRCALQVKKLCFIFILLTWEFHATCNLLFFSNLKFSLPYNFQFTELQFNVTGLSNIYTNCSFAISSAHYAPERPVCCMFCLQIGQW
jgi:hypothetical protein